MSFVMAGKDAFSAACAAVEPDREPTTTHTAMPPDRNIRASL
jgi:hypothetical protein